jgi:two-component system phosphate regulon sensor histidine kinase PhoR
MFLRNLKIQTKINAVFLVFIFFLSVVIGVGVYGAERIASSSDQPQVIQQAHNTELALLLVGLLATLLCFGGTFIVTRAFNARLGKLRDVANKYAEGKFDERFIVDGDDEISDLAQNFNAMADRLKETYGHLEEKTQSLADQMTAIAEQNKNLGNTRTAMLSLLEDGKELEDNLRQERDRIQAIIHSMVEGLIVTNKDDSIVMINPAAERFLHVKSADVEGMDIATVLPLYQGDTLLSPSEYPMKQALEHGTAIAVDLEDNLHYKKTLDARLIPIAMAVNPLVSDKAVVGGICIFRDITSLKQLDESKVSFISIASHQLRTPLTSMRWFSEMLLDGEAGELNGEQKHFVERVYQGTDRMISLVNLLLQIARVEAGRLHVEPKLLDLVSMTKGVMLTIKTGLDAKKQKVEIITHPDTIPQIPMDQEVIWQVIQNLLTNANRYSPEGSLIEVTITQEGNTIEYSVKDSGIGIPPEQAEKLFEKFFRADNALQMVPEGSGLGLSLVKSLVEGWGGRIWYDSELGKGTTFHFTIGIEGMKPKEGGVGLAV